MNFVESFAEHFRSYRHDVSEKARQYCCGLMQAGGRKNMDRMAEVVPDAKSRNLQQFLTHSRWDAGEVTAHVARDVDAEIGDPAQAGLLLDETGFAKQGRNSAGVSRQWLGRLGKVDNGQVAVFGALARGRWVAPVGVRLYLPQEWTEDAGRCEEAGIPEGARTFRTKDELALEVVREARERGLRFGWVGADAGYGKGPGFMDALEDLGETFVIDVHSDLKVYREDPQPRVPAAGRRGRPARLPKTAVAGVGVSDLVGAFAPSEWRTVELRQTTRGSMLVQAARAVVWVWDGVSESARRRHLVATRMPDGTNLKISLSNAAEGTKLKRLAFMQRQRYWVERAFEDAKGECGMADYQARKWAAWHHHMALVMMAMLFLLRERRRYEDTIPLLTCADIEELLAEFLPRRKADPESVVARMRARHSQRKRAIISHTKAAQAALSKGGRR